jgi:hypothetical protein
MAMYQLAEGHDNAAGFVPMSTIFIEAQRLAHITSLGSHQPARFIEGLDGISRPDGGDVFTWTFEWMSAAEVAYIKTTFLNGEYSGYVTVETLNSDGDWIEQNAILTLPFSYTLRGVYYGNVVFSFKDGVTI